MGYCLNCLDEPVFIAVSNPILTEFDIHYRWESCAMLAGVHYPYETIMYESNHIPLRGCWMFIGKGIL